MKIYITEKQKDKLFLIQEGLSDKLYHFTSIKALINILKTNTLYCQSVLGNVTDDKWDSGFKNLFFVSFSRNKSPYEGYGYYKANTSKHCVRIEFDGQMLGQKFKGGPVNYFGAGEMRDNKWSYHRRAVGVSDATKNNLFHYMYYNLRTNKIPEGEIVKKVNRINDYPTVNSPNFIEYDGKVYKKVPLFDGSLLKMNQKELYSHQCNETEDRLYTNQSVIKNILDYIIRIDILVPPLNENDVLPRNDFYEILSIFGFQEGYYFNEKRKIYLYDNKKDFNFQTSNYINDEYMYAFGNVGDDNYDKHLSNTINEMDAFNAKNVAKFFMYILYGKKMNEIIVYAAKMLKNYGLEEYTKQVIKEISNDYKYFYTSYNSNIDYYCNDLSTQPTAVGQKILQMFSDLLIKNGYHNLKELYKDFKEYVTNK